MTIAKCLALNSSVAQHEKEARHLKKSFKMSYLSAHRYPSAIAISKLCVSLFLCDPIHLYGSVPDDTLEGSLKHFEAGGVTLSQPGPAGIPAQQ